MTIAIWGAENVVRYPVGINVELSSVTMLPNGGYVVAWHENGNKIGFQLYNGLGQQVPGGLHFLPGSANAQLKASVTAFGGDGDFVVTWAEASTTQRLFYSQKYSFDGTVNGGPIAVGAGALNGSQDTTEMTSGQAGWATAFIQGSAQGSQVRLVQYDGAGNQTPAVEIYNGGSANVDVAYLGGTSHVVSYTIGSDIKIKVYDGATVGAEATIANGGMGDVIALKNAAGAPNGEFVVFADLGVAGGITAYRYTVNGNIISDNPLSLRISDAIKPSSPDLVNATALAGGGYAVAYVAADGDTGDIFVKVVDAAGLVGNALKVNPHAGTNGPQDTPTISEMADGRLAVSWHNGSIDHGVISTAIVDARTAGVAVTGTSHEDIFVGTEWADNLSGVGGDDLLIAGAGADQLYGGDDNDSLYGDAGIDALNGGDGDDLLVGGLEADLLDGGAGDDKASYQNSSAVIVNLATGTGTGGEATGDTYTSIERVLGSSQGDQLTGHNLIASTLEGGAGNDWLVGGAAADRLDGGAGSDTVSYAGLVDPITVNLGTQTGVGGDVLIGIENVVGTDGNDTFYGSNDINVFTGGLGNDTYYLQNTGDYVAEAANAGIDTVNTTASYALLANVENLVGAGSDAISLTGNDLANNITGNGADNVINGGGGADIMTGGAGNDIYYVDNAGDIINDTSGNDTVVITGNISLANFIGVENVMLSTSGDSSLDGNTFGNTLTGNNAANVLNGLGGDDILLGLGGNDKLYGGDGNDLLKGGDGIDVLYGLAGNDTLYGGAGKDTLYGGNGKDVFAFDIRANKNTNLDRVADFSVRDDSIWLDNAVFSSKIGKGTPTSARHLSKSFFKVGTKAGDKNDYFVYNKAKATLYYDSDGSGKKAMIEIAKFDKKPSLTVSDLFVI